MKIEKAGDLVSTHKIILYGAPGVGKTDLSCQGPRPTLLLDFDGGASHVKNSPRIDVEGLDIVREFSMPEIVELSERLVRGEAIKYKLVVFDSLTELQVLHRRSLLAGDRLDATKRDYGTNTEWVRRVVKNLQVQSQVHVIYIAHEDSDEDVDGLKIHPSFTPALLRSVEAYVDAIIYMSARTVDDAAGNTRVQRVAITMGNERFRAKDRTGRLPYRVLDPLWDTLFGSLFDEGEAEDRQKGGENE